MVSHFICLKNCKVFLKNIHVYFKMSIEILKEKHLNDYISLLSELTHVGKIENATSIYEEIDKCHNIIIFVYVIDEKIVGGATVIIEQKFIHGGKKVGHIEDVVVKKDHRGNGIGQELINKCVQVSDANNCYKVILDCDESNISFYTKNGFKEKGVCMRLDLIK